jgi:NNP family nitrate/nitrite transporter-like MFS transporter
MCFATWRLIGAFASTFRQLYQLTATQAAFLIAVPVLLGLLARIPMGILTDRFGGRIVFIVLVCAAPRAPSHWQAVSLN